MRPLLLLSSPRSICSRCSLFMSRDAPRMQEAGINALLLLAPVARALPLGVREESVKSEVE